MPSRASSSPLSPEKKCDTNPSREQRTQLFLQIKSAEEKSLSLHSQKSPQWAEQLYFKKDKKSFFRMLWKTCVCRPEIGQKHIDKLKPEPGRKPGVRPEKSRPDSQLCQKQFPQRYVIYTYFCMFFCSSMQWRTQKISRGGPSFVTIVWRHK